MREILKSRRMALLGTYQPRQCGIATFTSDLAHSLAVEVPDASVLVVAMNDIPSGYRYPPEVRFEIGQNQLADYRLAAEFLNMNRVDVVCVQHEYGIFGGPEGEHVMILLGALRMPVVTTLHTILRDPTAAQRRVLRDLAAVSDRLVTMSERGGRFLREVYGIPESKIAFIPHGVPDMPFVDPNYYKDQFGVEGKRVILTFGLLSPNKGIENVIRALPDVIRRHPEVVYLVLGATHPHVKKIHGESYRLQLQQLATELGVDEHVVFHNRFVELSELCEFLGAADIYVTPYLNEAQIVSGTLSYAMSTGKATISTPYWYATEMLAENRGRIVPFGDPEAIAEQINALLDDEIELHAIRKRAYTYCRSHVWKEVARRYLEVFEEVRRERQREPRPVYLAPSIRASAVTLPQIRLSHMQRLTDDVGILQHATYSTPNRSHGYCTDDNARALVVATRAQEYLPDTERLAELSVRYLSFLQHAFNPDRGTFRNFLGYDRRWLEEEGSQDSQGRALMALGVSVARSGDDQLRAAATQLFQRAAPAMERLTSPRAVAFALAGAHYYMQTVPGDSFIKRLRVLLADRLMDGFRRGASEEWPWPEEIVTYSNASLPAGLLLSGRDLERHDMIEMGLRSLQWLLSVQLMDGHFVPVGNDGWFSSSGRRARFDQQPVEAETTIDACIWAFRITGDRQWLDHTTRVFQWFLGQNDLGVPLCDHVTGACFDGLQASAVNQNQGAEATLAWLNSLIQMHMLQAEGLLQGSQPSHASRAPELAEASLIKS